MSTKVQFIGKVHNKIQTDKNIERVQNKQQNTDKPKINKSSK
jgi:hypothetical protein